MKTIIYLGVLWLACLGAVGGEFTGGLVDTALSVSDLGGHWAWRIKLMLDPQATPSEFFQIATNVSRRHPLAAAEMQARVARQTQEKRDFISNALADIGAEAQIRLEYQDSEHKRFSIDIIRYKSVETLAVTWKHYRAYPQYAVTNVAGEEVICTSAGQVFLPGKLTASQSSLQVRVGRYHVMVSPGKPEADDPGLSLARKQVEKIKKCIELVMSHEVARREKKADRKTAEEIVPPGAIK